MASFRRRWRRTMTRLTSWCYARKRSRRDFLKPSLALPAQKNETHEMKETAAALKKRARRINALLAKLYPDARCALHHKNPLELLVATILSAQCTDERVNKVTPAL